jgi:MoaA/NifB/PqqE/SkfB family radical SAM enzyme
LTSGFQVEAEIMTDAGLHSREAILQIHASRRCNLSCAHCYSSSSPHELGSLPPQLTAQVVRDAAAIGVRVVSLSGGEPLLYGGLPAILATARDVGSKVNLVSNGTLIRSARFDAVADRLDVVALSLDGLRERHIAVRQSPRQFDDVLLAAKHLAQNGKRFGVIHALTRESLDELEELAALASDLGAELLQIHPFEPFGRGATATGMTALDADERLDAFLIAHTLGQQYPHMRIQLDLVHRDVARYAPAALGAPPMRVASFPAELIVRENGVVEPLMYGMGDRWRVTTLSECSLAEAWPRFMERTWPELRRVVRGACLQTARGRHGEVVSWHRILRDSASSVEIHGTEYQLAG